MVWTNFASKFFRATTNSSSLLKLKTRHGRREAEKDGKLVKIVEDPEAENSDIYGSTKHTRSKDCCSDVSCYTGSEQSSSGIGSDLSNSDKKEQNLTSMQASWNITNMIQVQKKFNTNIGPYIEVSKYLNITRKVSPHARCMQGKVYKGNNILAVPYALLIGGILSIVFTVVVGYISCYTCKLLVDCLYDEGKNGEKIKKRNTLYDIAVENLGKTFGGILMDNLQIGMMLSVCVLNLLFSTNMIDILIPHNPLGFNGTMIIIAVTFLPFAFVRSNLMVSKSSCVSVILTSALTLVMTGYFLSKSEEWKIESIPITSSLFNTCVSLGIIISGFDAQVYVTTLEGEMRPDASYNKMLAWTHFVGVIVKAGFGLVSVLTYGPLTQQTITNNIDFIPMRYIFNIIFPIKCFLIVQFPYFSIVNLLEEKLFQGKGMTYFPSCLNENNRMKWWALLLRILLIVFVVLICIALPDLALMSGYVGTITGSLLLFILPVYFHLNLKWRIMKWYSIVHEIFILIFGVFAMFCGIFMFVQAAIMS